MATTSIELTRDVEELRALLGTATRQKVKDMLTIEIRKLETVITGLKEAEQAGTTASDSPANAQPKPRPTTATPVVRLRDYAWDQSDKFVKFYLTIPGVHTLEESSVSLSTTASSCTLQARYPDKVQTFVSENLLNEIVPEKSYHKVKTDQVVILLKKAQEGKKWTHVTATEKQIKEAREAKKMETFDKDGTGDSDPTAGIMQIMKKMYQEGDDEMKRSIAKAWTQAQNSKASLDMPDP